MLASCNPDTSGVGTGRAVPFVTEACPASGVIKGGRTMVSLERCLETPRAIGRLRDLAGIDIAERAIEAYLASTGDVDGLEEGFAALAQEENEVSDLIADHINQLRRDGSTVGVVRGV